MEEIKQRLEQVIEEIYAVKTEAEVTVAPEDTGADYASNVAMKLAKLVHRAPRVIAEEIKAAFLPDAANWQVEIAGPGFLNFVSPKGYFYDKVAELADQPGDFKRKIAPDMYHGQTVVCEFSDPNPFKVLHVGHFYTSVVGDGISRLLECAGAKVVRANFGGDVGLHVGKTIWALMNQDRTGELTIGEVAKAYIEGTRAYDEDERAKAEIIELNKEIYRISEGDIHEGEVAEIYWRGRELSYQYFRDFYRKIGVEFDKYYPESTVAGRGLSEVRAHTGSVYEESDGAVVYRGEKFGLHTRVFINQAGLPTYEAKDVGLIFTKWDDWHFDESVVITGNDIIEYMKVVLASVSEYAPELTERTVHLTHGLVKLPGNEKMSSRKGNFLKAVDVLEMVREMLGGERADEKVVLAAIKYAFLRYKMGGDIIFDPKESVSTTGNSGVYLLYSTVRAGKILRSCKAAGRSEVEICSLPESQQVFVQKLCKKIVQYQDELVGAVREKAPYKICNYLYELAQEFSRFYEHVQVVGSEQEAELAKVVKAYAMVMEHGLGLLGIEVPEEM